MAHRLYTTLMTTENVFILKFVYQMRNYEKWLRDVYPNIHQRCTRSKIKCFTTFLGPPGRTDKEEYLLPTISLTKKYLAFSEHLK
jgi:hypothetical protein